MTIRSLLGLMMVMMPLQLHLMAVRRVLFLKLPLVMRMALPGWPPVMEMPLPLLLVAVRRVLVLQQPDLLRMALWG